MLVRTNHIDHIYPCITTLNIINVRIEHVHTTQQVPLFPQKGDSLSIDMLHKFKKNFANIFLTWMSSFTKLCFIVSLITTRVIYFRQLNLSRRFLIF